MCTHVRRILQQEKRNVLLRQLEEATRITTYLHSQLKRCVIHIHAHVYLDLRMSWHSSWLLDMTENITLQRLCNHLVLVHFLTTMTWHGSECCAGTNVSDTTAFPQEVWEGATFGLWCFLRSLASKCLKAHCYRLYTRTSISHTITAVSQLCEGGPWPKQL